MTTMERHGHGLKASLEWLNWAAQLPAKAVPFNTSADTLIYGGRCLYMGFSMANNAVGGGNFNLYNGRDATGAPLNLDFPSNGSTINRAAPGQGVLCDVGVFLHVSTGPMAGSVFLIPLNRNEWTAPGE